MVIEEITPYKEESFSLDPSQAIVTIRNHFGLGLWPWIKNELSVTICTICFRGYLRSYEIKDERYHRDCYDHFHGLNAWDNRHEQDCARHKSSAFELGFTQSQAVLELNQPLGILMYDGEFPEEFKRGMEAALESNRAKSQGGLN